MSFTQTYQIRPKSVRIVSYTANGSEVGTGLTVPIGATLSSTSYHVAFFGTPDDALVPLAWSFPDAGRTTTQFVAHFLGDSLTPGAVYKFQIVEA